MENLNLKHHLSALRQKASSSSERLIINAQTAPTVAYGSV